MKEPERQTSLDTLESYVADRIRRVISRMEARGFDPVVFEAARTLERQQWLYGIGRTHDLKRKPVTWTMASRHIPHPPAKGKAADIISKSRGWNWPEFYQALREEAQREGLRTLSVEQCHVQFG